MVKEFKDLLHELKDEHKLSLSKMEEKTGVSRKTIHSWMKGTMPSSSGTELVLSLIRGLQMSRAKADQLLDAASIPKLATLKHSPEPTIAKLATEILQSLPKTLIELPNETVLIGRDALTEEIINAIVNQDLNSNRKKRIFVLHGLGGVGKTVLAITVARQLSDHFVDGVVYIDLRNTAGINGQKNTDPILAGMRLCLNLYGVPLTGYDTIGLVTSAYKQLMRDKKVLLLLDNANVESDIGDFFIADSSEMVVLATTRSESLIGELALQQLQWQKRIEPLSINNGRSLLKLTMGDEDLDQNIEIANQVIESVGGLPLAIRIIGARLKSASPSALVNYVKMMADTNVSIPPELFRDGEQCVYTSLELSYNFLELPTQALFAYLSFLDGNDVSEETILELVPPDPAILTQLRLGELKNVCLLEARQENGTTRYTMHPMVRTFARAKLLEMGNLSHLEDKVISFFKQYVLSYAVGSTPQLNREWAGIKQAWELLKARQASFQEKYDLVEPLTRPYLGTAGYLDISGRWHIAQQILETLRDILPIELKQSFIAAQIYLRLAIFYYRMEMLDASEQAIQQSQGIINNLAPDPQAKLLEAMLLEYLASIFCQTKRKEDAKDAIEQANDLFALHIETKHPEQGHWLVQQAGLIARLNDLARARQLITEGIEALKRLPESEALVNAFKMFGNIAYHEDNFIFAQSMWKPGLDLAQTLQDRRNEYHLRQNLAVIASLQGNFVLAIDEQKELATIYRDMGEHRQHVMMLINLSDDYISYGEFDMAQDWLREAAEERPKHDYLAEANVRIEVNTGRLHLERQNFDQAADYITRAEERNRQETQEFLIPEIALLQVNLALVSGQNNKVIALFHEHKDQNYMTPYPKMVLYRLVAQALARLDQIDDAKYYLDTGLTYFKEQQMRFDIALSYEAYYQVCQAAGLKQDAQEWRCKAHGLFKELDIPHHIKRLET